MSNSYPRGQTGSPFNKDFTHKGMAYQAIIYSYHKESHLFKTKLNERDCVNKYFISYSL